MSIKVIGTTVIDDSRNLTNVASITYPDATVQTTAGAVGVSPVVTLRSGGSLVQTINNPNAYSTSASDQFGYSVAISGNYAIVGAYNEDDVGGATSGKAYIFNVTTGVLLFTLNNPNAYGTSAGDFFGSVVAIDGNYAIVGASGEDDTGGTAGLSSGKAYIFNVTTGALLHTLNNPNAFSTFQNDFFGSAVAISGNYAIVGASSEDDAGGADSGKAYIFNVTTGALLFTLDNPNAYSTSVNDAFGQSVGISGNYAIVSAVFESDAGGGSSGKAYIYDVTTGALLFTLNDPNAYSTSFGDQFGYSVAVSGNYAIVGASSEDDAGGSGSGKAYIYDVTTGSLLFTLDNPNAYSTSASDEFGRSVAIDGNYAIVGANAEDDAGGTTSGKAYIFNVTTGALLYTLNNPTAYSTSASDNFGYSVAIDGNYAIVGAYFEADLGGATSGKAYIFAIRDIFGLDNINQITLANGLTLGSDSKLLSTSIAGGQLTNTLNNPNAYSTSANDFFGNSVAISGNYAIVGAWGEADTGGNQSGKAYIYNATTGALLFTLNNPNAYSTSAVDAFGYSVAISGNYAIVGAYVEDDASGSQSGKAYIFNVTNGQLLFTLNNPNAYISLSTSDSFGWSVAISGNYAIVGAYAESDTGGVSSGKAYIYNVTTGALLFTLNNPNVYSTSANDNFGQLVAISGNYAIVGANQEDAATGAEAGKAYIYNVTTGALLYTLNAPAGNLNDQFGFSVAVSGNYAIVGAYLEDAGGTDSGKAYIYNVTTGALLFTLNNPNAYSTSAGDNFGYKVAIDNNYAIVSAWTEDDLGGAGSGKAYIYNATTGALLYTLDNPNAYSTSSSDAFGRSVSISGNYAIVGAYQEDDAGGASSGKAYIFSVKDQTYLDRMLNYVS